MKILLQYGIRNHMSKLHIYIIQSSDINVKACGCDSLYRTVHRTNYHFCCFNETECSFVYL